MQEPTFSEINIILNQVKKKLSVEVSENELLRKIDTLSGELSELKKKKDYYETAKTILEFVLSNYKQNISRDLKFMIITCVKELDEGLREMLKQILYKTDKLEKNELILDFFTTEDFQKIVKIRSNKRLNDS